MPGANRYESKRRVYVKPFQTSAILYGFLTNCSASAGTACGHTAITSEVTAANIVFGANAPKPGKARRRQADGYDETFYDFDKYGDLRQAGWALSMPKIKRARTTPRTRTVAVNMGTFKYAWNIPLTTAQKIGATDLTALGIEAVTGNERSLVWGTSNPKPIKVSKFTTGAGGVDTITTFAAPGKLDELPDGWSAAGTERTAPNL